MDDTEQRVLALINADIEAKKLLKTQMDRIISAAFQIDRTFWKGGKVLIFGNGGSAADSQHIAAEFVGHFNRERKALPAIALTTDTSILTAVSNDFGFEQVFERQVEALCLPEDTVMALSTSGESKNVIRGIQAAKRIRAYTVGLVGRTKSTLSEIVDLKIRGVSKNTAEIQQSHLLIGHIIAEIVEKWFVEGWQGDPLLGQALKLHKSFSGHREGKR